MLLVADDYLLECGGSACRRGLLTFFVLCAVLGGPLSWHKTSVGDVLVWVGFELLLRSRCVGISARRAEWFVRWTQKVADSDTVSMASFGEGLGRIMFVAGALEHERPFLGPLYRFISIHPKDSIRRIPPYVKFILRYLADQVTNQRHYQCSSMLTTTECLPRVDGQASAQRTGIGGWFPVANSTGTLDPWLSSWFSLEITKSDFPWIFEKGDKPSLVYTPRHMYIIKTGWLLDGVFLKRKRRTCVTIFYLHRRAIFPDLSGKNFPTRPRLQSNPK